MENLKGKTAFITGGASGIGLGTAKAMAKEGMNIVLADFRQSAIDEALVWFKENNYPAIGVLLDVTDREAYERAADEAEAAFGKIHILDNNAGIGIGEPNFAEGKYSYDDIDFAINVNYRGVMNGLCVMIPRILKHGEGGHIVSTASKAGLVPVPGFPLYNSLKMAVITLMETMYCDLKKVNIGASVFCPGPFVTNLGMSSMELKSKHFGIEMPSFPAPPKPKDGEEPKAPPVMPGFEGVDFGRIQRDPLEAGERIVQGIKRGDLYIISHSEFKKGWEARAAAIARSFPDEEPYEPFYKIFSMLAYNPAFDTVQQVPAYKKGE